MEFFISIPEIRQVSSNVTNYVISVKGSVKGWSLHKRFSEFVALDQKLLLLGDLPKVLPPKALWRNDAVVESRRVALELYLQAILNAKDPIHRNSAAWIDFLDLPLVEKGPGGVAHLAIDPQKWMQEYELLCSFISQIKSVCNEKEKCALAGDSTAAQTKKFQARKGLKQAQENVQTLREGLSSVGMVAGEHHRRQDLVQNVQNEVNELEERLRAYTFESSSRGLNSSRIEVLVNVQTNAKSSRKFGVAQETDQTRVLDDHGVLQLQNKVMAVQDKVVDNLAEIVRRQKEISLTISNELDIQNALLEQVDEGVVAIGSKMKTAEKKIKRVVQGG